MLWRNDFYQDGILQSKTYQTNCFLHQGLHSQVPGGVLMSLTELNCLCYQAAQQIYIVLTARKERKKQFIFSDGDCVDLNPEFGIFLTMVRT